MLRGAAIPVQVRAYLSGKVVEVLPKEGCIIENDVMFVQGIFGIGGETEGVIQVACSVTSETLEADRDHREMKGAVILGGARMTAAALRKAIEVGAAAVVSGGLDDQDLKELLGRDLGVAITGSETIGITVIVTEGFGDIAMAARTWRLLAERAGRTASVNGADPDPRRRDAAGDPGAARAGRERERDRSDAGQGGWDAGSWYNRAGHS